MQVVSATTCNTSPPPDPALAHWRWRVPCQRAPRRGKTRARSRDSSPRTQTFASASEWCACQKPRRKLRSIESSVEAVSLARNVLYNRLLYITDKVTTTYGAPAPLRNSTFRLPTLARGPHAAASFKNSTLSLSGSIPSSPGAAGRRVTLVGGSSN